MPYPSWAWFPRQNAPEPWVAPFIDVLRSRQSEIDSKSHKGLVSDALLARIRPGLQELGWEVEEGKLAGQKIHRPVLFGDNGAVKVKQEIDAWHPTLHIVLEMESGRAWMGNAVYRDLVRASLIADADYLVIGVRVHYEYGEKQTIRNDFESTRDLLDSIYASGRLLLPFKGILVVGW